jgi:hypothetical protein
MRTILCVLAGLALSCTTFSHKEATYDNGKMTYRWETKVSTFIGDKEATFFVDTTSVSGQLQGMGIDEEFRDIALRAIDKSPELAAAIIQAMKPGGALDGVLLELMDTDPDLGQAITEAIEDE